MSSSTLLFFSSPIAFEKRTILVTLMIEPIKVNKVVITKIGKIKKGQEPLIILVMKNIDNDKKIRKTKKLMIDIAFAPLGE